MAEERKQLIDIDGLSTFLARLRIEITSSINQAINNIGNATTTLRGFMSSADKTKLDNISESAEENVIESITINGVIQTITNKNVALAIPSGSVYSDTKPDAGDYWEQPY